MTMEYKMPCLSCGRLLEGTSDVLACPCGVSYTKELVDNHRRPGYHREWLAAFGCTCGRVQRDADTVVLTRHRCRSGGIGMIDGSN